MTRRTQLVSMLGLGSALLLSSAVYAQPGRPGGPVVAPPVGAPAAGAPAAADSTVSNETTTTTTTTTDVDPGAAPTEDGTLPNTGGEPWLMALAGSITAGSGLMLRRKLS